MAFLYAPFFGSLDRSKLYHMKVGGVADYPMIQEESTRGWGSTRLVRFCCGIRSFKRMCKARHGGWSLLSSRRNWEVPGPSERLSQRTKWAAPGEQCLGDLWLPHSCTPAHTCTPAHARTPAYICAIAYTCAPSYKCVPICTYTHIWK